MSEVSKAKCLLGLHGVPPIVQECPVYTCMRERVPVTENDVLSSLSLESYANYL